MSIIISKRGQNAQKIDRADFEAEDNLQDYIHKNPEAIPIYEIEKDKKLLVVKREFETNSGPIDALAVDKDGDIYIVETKLYKNPDKRTVVAQALDYGAALWKHFNDFQEFINVLDAECQKNFNQTFKEKIIDFFNLDEEQAEMQLESMKKNLNDGNLKFVVLMDSIEERLKNLIIYVNQNSQFDIYAVQLEYYKFNDYEIMIPKIFGVEVKKSIKTNGSTRRKWTREEFLQDAKEKSGDSYNLIEKLLIFSEDNASSVVYGTGREDGNFSYKLRTKDGEITLFCAYSNGEIYARLGFIQDIMERVPDEMAQLIEAFKKIKGVSTIKHFEKGTPIEEYSLDVLTEANLKETEETIMNFTKKVKA